MLSVNKKVGAVILSVFIMFAAVMPASAQWRRDRYRTSGKEKAAWIGGGAAVGAVVGGMLNGSKGAVIGGLLGAGAGTGAVIIKDKRAEDRYDRYRERNYRSRYYNSRYYRDYAFRR